MYIHLVRHLPLDVSRCLLNCNYTCTLCRYYDNYFTESSARGETHTVLGAVSSPISRLTAACVIHHCGDLHPVIEGIHATPSQTRHFGVMCGASSPRETGVSHDTAFKKPPLLEMARLIPAPAGLGGIIQLMLVYETHSWTRRKEFLDCPAVKKIQCSSK